MLDAKLQETSEMLGRLEARHVEVQRLLALLDDSELEVEWVKRCLADFDKVWDTLGPENRMRLVHAIVERVEVDEPGGEIRAFMTDLGSDAGDTSGATEGKTP